MGYAAVAKHRRGKRAAGKCAFHGCNVDCPTYRCRKHADSHNAGKRERRATLKAIPATVVVVVTA